LNNHVRQAELIAILVNALAGWFGGLELKVDIDEDLLKHQLVQGQEIQDSPN